jgi:hypothetical protein
MRRLAAAVLTATLSAAPLSASAWNWTTGGLEGSGKKVTQARQVGEFRAVRLEGSFDVSIQVGAPRAVAVTIDENLQPLVETRLVGDTLVVSSQNMSYRGEGRVRISTPALQGLDLEGSGDVTIEGGRGDQRLSLAGSGDVDWKGSAAALEVSIAGSGTVTLAGKAEVARLRIDGSGDVKARGLAARDADVEVSGSGDVELTLDGGTFRAAVSGSGQVAWHGRATVERASVSGSGEILHR